MVCMVMDCLSVIKSPIHDPSRPETDKATKGFFLYAEVVLPDTTAALDRAYELPTKNPHSS